MLSAAAAALQSHCFAAENYSFPFNLRLAELKEYSPLPQMLTAFSVPYFLLWKCGVEGISVCVPNENGGASSQAHFERVMGQFVPVLVYQIEKS